ncbi:MAG TPA: peptidoglycan-binding protein [Acidimicrobiia bacterium]|jgi:N-acetylmuramoyl-L-alanine amidase|nr:peptidoglycan-binding protein [Acidimicrobiia bacterium]
MTTALQRGEVGEGVRDLQRRLAALGHDSSADEPGDFGPATETAVRHFQQQRGLLVDGLCGTQTWAALVESGFTLGDRMLYFRQPMLRGDDVAELQRRLNALGFDAGREDGILGRETAAAIVELQRNLGLAPDGICGPATVAALRRVDGLAAGSVASVREREMLRRGPHGLAGRRVFLTASPGFEALGDAVARGLAEAGAGALLDSSGADDSTTAIAANEFGAALFLALRARAGSDCLCSYFSTGTFRSEAGYRVAAAVQEELAELLTDATGPCGKAYAILRETRMAAVVCELVEHGDVDGMRHLVARAGDVSRAIVRGVRRGVEQPADG